MLHMTKTELNEEIKALEGMQAAYRSRIRVTRTNMTNNEFFERTRTGHLKKIEYFQSLIADLDYSRENGAQIIQESLEKIADLGKRIKLLKHRRDIERLLEMQRQINELEEDEQELEDTSEDERELEVHG